VRTSKVSKDGVEMDEKSNLLPTQECDNY